MIKNLLILLVLLSGINTIYSQVVTPFAVRKTLTQKGGIVYLSNTSSKANPTSIVQNELPVGGTGYNNNFTNTYVDIDADPTTWMSSSDQLNLPACTEISWAGLYWGADCSSGDENFATRTQVKLKINSGSYIDLTADYLKDNTVGYKTYHCYKDITSIVSGGGLNSTYTIANMAGDIGNTNLFGGWTIVVMYKNSSMTMRNLTVFDGLASVSSGTFSTVDIPISGFLTPPSGPVNFELGLVGYDGDRSLTGDQLLFKGGTTFVNISDVLHPVADVFNSTITNNGAYTTNRNPNYNNTLGYDANIFVPDNSAKNYIGNNAVSATIRQTTGGETFLTQVVTSAIDVYDPNLQSYVNVRNVTNPGAALANSGDILEYSMNLLNVGSDPSVNSYVVDTLEGNVQFIPGSITIVSGPNAGVKTDAIGDDQAEYYSASKSIKVRIGTGANNFMGGVINNSPVGSDSTKVTFRVQVSNDCVYLSCDHIVNNTVHIIGTGNISGNVFDNPSISGNFNPLGCPVSGSTNSVINIVGCAPPTASVNSTICQGGTINLSATGSLSASYFWTGPNGFTSTLQSPTITNATIANSGVYTVNIFINGTSCTFVRTVTVNINAANAGPDQTGTSTCGLTTVTLAGNLPAGSNGVWTIVSGVGGSFGATNTATSTNPTSTFNGVAGSTYVLKWSLTSPGCPATFDNVTITFQNAASSATLSAISATCANTLKVNVVGGVSPFTLFIDNGIGSISGYVSGTNISVNPSTTTSYNLLSVIGSNGCPVTTINGNPSTITINNAIGTGTIVANTAATQTLTSSVGPNFAGTTSNFSATNPWVNPGNATTNNSNYATYSTSNSTSTYLVSSNYGFSIPSNATISGIKLEIRRKTSSTSNGRAIRDSSVVLYGGTGTSLDRKLAANWSSNSNYFTYGSNVDLWGMTWTPAQINSSGFGAGLRAKITGTPTASVDAFRITVYYTIPAYCDDLAAVSYTATGFTNVSNYTWNPPAGASIVSGQGTANVVFNLNGAGQSGNFAVAVTPSNTCGAGTPVSIVVPITDCVNSSATLCVKGNVYWDVNGSNGSGKVDGTGIGTAAGSQLYVVIYRTNGPTQKSFATVPVNADGTWQICSSRIVSNASYRVYVTKTNYPDSSTNLSSSLPNNVSSNGEINNDNGNTITGNDGNTDGRISFSTANPMTNNETNLNFGLKIKTPPVANLNAGTTNEDTPITFNITSNDTDIDGTITTSTVVLSTSSSNGTWVKDALGNITYTPAANFSGTASITYTVRDNDNMTSNSATITITVIAVNDPPIATASVVTTPENSTYTFVTSNFQYTDVELNALTSITITSLPALGTLTFAGVDVVVGQTILVGNMTDLKFTPLPSQYGSPYTTFNFTANDLSLGLVEGVMTVNVTHLIAPPTAVDDNATTNQNVAVSINVLTNDFSIDGTITANTVDLDPYTNGIQTTYTIPGQGTYVVNSSGVVTFTPVSTFYGTTIPLPYTFKSSLNLVSNIAYLNITVSPLGAPVAVNNAVSTNENTAVVFNITSNDYDTDGGTINVSRVDFDPSTPGYQQSIYIAGEGTFVVDILGTVTFTPDWNFDGVSSTIYTVVDNTNLVSNVATITVTVSWTNNPPTVVDDNAVTNEDTPVTISILNNDSDMDVSHGNAGIIDVASVDLDLSIPGIQNIHVIPGEGTFTVNNSGVVTFTPDANFFGIVTPIGYRIKDLAGALSDSATIFVTVNPINDAPVAVNDVAFSTATASVSSVVFDISTNDYDIDGTIDLASFDLNPNIAGVQTTFTVAGEGTYTVDNMGNVTFQYTFATPVAPLTPVNYVVLDDLGLVSNYGVINVTILQIGVPLAVNDDVEILEDTPTDFSIFTNDVDNFGTNPGISPVSIALLGSLVVPEGTWSIADPINFPGFVRFTPAPDFYGAVMMNYTINDLDGNLSNPGIITVNVLPVNDAPSVTNGANQVVLKNSGVHVVNLWASDIVSGPANESDQSIDMDDITNDNNVLFLTQPTIDNQGNLSYTVAFNQVGTAIVRFRIVDNGGTDNGGIDTANYQTFTISIIQSIVPLPITLTKFNAECSTDGVLVNWETASEQNSDYFIIERSEDGVIWTQVGAIKAAGNSNTYINYQFEDKTVKSRINYYQLKQFDFNGTAYKFDAISSDCSSGLEDFNLYPNPTSSSFSLQFTTSISESNTIVIYDLSGKELKRIDLEKSEYIISIIDVSDLAPGLYTLDLDTNGSKKLSRKFIKL